MAVALDLNLAVGIPGQWNGTDKVLGAFKKTSVTERSVKMGEKLEYVGVKLEFIMKDLKT